MTVSVLTNVIGEAGREVMSSRTRREAQAIVDAAVVMIERLGVLVEDVGQAGEPTPEPPVGMAPQPGAGTVIAGA